jgi:hypothetical protein
MTWPGVTQDVEHGVCMLHLSSMSNDKVGVNMQEIWPAPTQNRRIWHGTPGSWSVWI